MLLLAHKIEGMDVAPAGVETFRTGPRVIRSILLDVAVAEPDVSAARASSNVIVYLFDANNKLVETVSRLKPVGLGNAVTILYDDDAARDARAPTVTARVKLDPIALGRADPHVTCAVFVVTQRTHVSQLGQPPTGSPVAVSSALRVHVAAVVEAEAQPSSIELTLGTFDPIPPTEGGAGARNIYEVIAGLVSAKALDAKRPASEWAIVPVRRIGTLVTPKQLREYVKAEIVPNLFHPGSFESPMFLDDLVNDVLDLHRTSPPPVPPPPQFHWTPSASEGSGELEEPPLKPEPAPQTFQAAEDLRRHELDAARDMLVAVQLLKDSSNNLRDMAERVYATPWARQETLPPPPTACMDPTVAHHEDLKLLKEDIRREFLDVLEDYTQKKDIGDLAAMRDTRYSELARLRRDMQEMRQKHTELERLVHQLCTWSPKGGAREPPCAGTPAVDTAMAQLFRVSDSAKRDPLLTSFLEFMRGLEIASQLTGESFRQLQTRLHYPEAYKDIALNTTYPAARILLEFLSSKKASNLVQDVETIMGAFRAGGTGVPSDYFRESYGDAREFAREPWWPLRPFHYN